jgi:aminoglycoside phosphotransferase (APT) family kinase protein
VKLLKAGATRWESRREARMTRAIFAAGAPAPEVFGEVELEGRFGIVLSRFDGPTLLQLTRSGAITFEQAGAILASLCLSVHKTPPPPEVPFVRDVMDSWLRSSGAAVPKHIATGILALLERLRPGDGLCHADLHPGNVIMTAEGPRLVDWTSTVRASAAYDLGVSQIVLTELAPEAGHDPEWLRALTADVQSEYARLAGLSPAALTAEIESYLPIVRVLVALGGAVPNLRERLLQRVEAAVRPQD